MNILYVFPSAYLMQTQSETEHTPQSTISTDMTKEGYLWKKGRGISGEWQRRWFVVRGGLMYYLIPDRVCILLSVYLPIYIHLSIYL